MEITKHMLHTQSINKTCMTNGWGDKLHYIPSYQVKTPFCCNVLLAILIKLNSSTINQTLLTLQKWYHHRHDWARLFIQRDQIFIWIKTHQEILTGTIIWYHPGFHQEVYCQYKESKLTFNYKFMERPCHTTRSVKHLYICVVH